MNFIENWQEEKSSAYLYKLIAAEERNPTRKKLFEELSLLATKQAAIWEQEILKANKEIPAFRPHMRTHLVGSLIKIFGTKRLRFILSAMKVRGMSVYLTADPDYPFAAPVHQHSEHRHGGLSSAGNLRAAVFGVNDGLISNASLLLGVVGAAVDYQTLLVTGVAGMLAGACSMAAGEYVSVRSQREFFEYQIDLERKELAQYPQEEAAELAAIYRARGLPKEDAEALATAMINNPEKALDTLAREELGLNPADLGSPKGAAISSFFSFLIGAFIPLVPFFFSKTTASLNVSLALSATTLFCIGATLSLYTNSNALKSGLRMLLIGIAAGGFTYLIGKWLGVVLH